MPGSAPEPAVPDALSHILQNTLHDVPKALILTAFVTAIAYIHSPRLKTLVFSMPIPFTCAFLASGIAIGPTHISGLVLVTLYHWIFYSIYRGLRLPLAAGIGVAVTLYVATAYLIANHTALPVTPFLWVCGASFLLWCIGVWLYRPIHEPGHRGKTPWWLKAPLIFVIALVIFSLTALLGGAVTTFPYAGVFTSYEMRHSPRTLAGQYTINNISFLLMFTTIWALQERVSVVTSLLGGWVVLLIALGLIYKLGFGRPQMAPPATE